MARTHGIQKECERNPVTKKNNALHSFTCALLVFFCMITLLYLFMTLTSSNSSEAHSNLYSDDKDVLHKEKDVNGVTENERFELPMTEPEEAPTTNYTILCTALSAAATINHEDDEDFKAGITYRHYSIRAL